MEKKTLVTCEVVGEMPIVDAKTGADVLKGNTVQLDPDETNIPALEQAGLVKAKGKNSTDAGSETGKP